jgi:hypothetical protein
VLDPTNGAEIAKVDGKFVYRIPESGELRVKDFDHFWEFRQTASYQDGTKIPIEWETWTGPLGEPPTLGKDVVVFQGGGISVSMNDPMVMSFYVGSVNEYEEWQRKQNPFLSGTDANSRSEQSGQQSSRN